MYAGAPSSIVALTSIVLSRADSPVPGSRCQSAASGPAGAPELSTPEVTAAVVLGAEDRRSRGVASIGRKRTSSNVLPLPPSSIESNRGRPPAPAGARAFFLEEHRVLNLNINLQL